MKELAIQIPEPKSDTIHLYFPGRPQTKKNQKSPGKYGGYYNPANTYEKLIRDHARMQFHIQHRKTPIFTMPYIAIFLRCYLKNRRCPDAGNIAECILDALQGGKNKEPLLYKNDNQIDLLIVKRIFDPSKTEGVGLSAWQYDFPS